MSIVGGSLIGTISTRLGPSGSVVGGSLIGGFGNAPPYAVPTLRAAPCGGGSMAVPPAAPPVPAMTAIPCAGGTAPAGIMPAAYAQPAPAPMAPAPGAQAAGEPAPAGGDPATLQVPCLTAGLPTPDAIAHQKEGYARSLEEQLRQGVELLGQTHKQKTDHLHATANQNKHQYNLMLDQSVKQQEMLLSQQYNQQLMMLQQAAQQQRAELEQQAAALTLEWQQRMTQEEFLKEQRGIQQRYAQVQQELAAEMEKVGVSQAGPNVITTPVAVRGPGVVAGGSAALPVGGGCSALLPVGGSAMLPVGGSAMLPVGGGASVATSAAPLAKYDAPAGLSATQRANPTAAAGRLQYVPPSGYAASSAGGSCALPVGGAVALLGSAKSYTPAHYAVPMGLPSRPASYVPPVLSGTVRTIASSPPSQSGSYVPAPCQAATVLGGSAMLPVGGGSAALPVGGPACRLAGGSAAVPVGGGGGSAALPVGGSMGVPPGAVAVYAPPPTNLAVQAAAPTGGSAALPVGGGCCGGSAALPVGGAALYAQAIAQAAVAQAAAAKAGAGGGPTTPTSKAPADLFRPSTPQQRRGAAYATTVTTPVRGG